LKGGDYWGERIRCVPITDETDSCLVDNDRAITSMMRTRHTPACACKIQNPLQNIWGSWAERAQQSIDQSITQSINQAQIAFPRPCSAMPCPRCHAHVCPTSHNRLDTWRHGRRRPAYYPAHRDYHFLHIDGNKGPNYAPQISIGYVADTCEKKEFRFQPSISTVAGQLHGASAD
jgi:hypothetical protein